MAKNDSNDARLLFCPFCRECYEGETVCPVHELRLVDFTALPKQAHERDLPGLEDDVDPWDVRFGRGWIALGALFVLVGFFMPFASATVEDQSVSWSGLDLANGPARTMWTVPFVAALYVWLLLRRRSVVKMAGARLVAFLLAFAPAASVVYSMVNMWRGIERLHGAGLLEWGLGIPVIAAGAALLAIGAVRFGLVPRGALPHGAGPEASPSAISVDRPSEPPP
ncbi:MAG: hypothetical protein KF729_19360 [Sandaracinaceae bacterium]|nr:hypothetical protein [Sandaracinaceae bacterium]